ncbi:MAG: hypothetical protein PUA49_02345 [Butyrivibrio sp.]|nr:hypothetical protein [Butyrivibrio sp.]
MEQETARNKREADYVKRVFYEKKYAGELRLYNMKKLLLERQESAVDETCKTSLFYRMKSAVYSFWDFGSYSIIATVGAYIYVAMINALAFSSGQFKEAMFNGIYISKNTALFANLRSFLERERKEHELRLPCNDIEEIVFDHVTFTYPGAEKPTIKDMNFTWKKGERIAKGS